MRHPGRQRLAQQQRLVLARRLLDAGDGDQGVRPGSVPGCGTAACPCGNPTPPAAAAARRRHPHRRCRRSRWPAKALFDFDKAVLKPEGMAALDSEVIDKLKDVSQARARPRDGHTDRIGYASVQPAPVRAPRGYRARLSGQPMVSHATRSRPLGMGKTQPIPGVVCDQNEHARN